VSGQYSDLIASAAQQYGVPPALLAWQLNQESSLNPDAVTGSAEGIAQIQPATAAQPGYGVTPISDPFDPTQAIPFAAQYDAALYQSTGSWSAALTKYGTLDNVPQSVTNSFNQVLADNNIQNAGGNLGATSGGSYPSLYPGGNYGGYNPAADPNAAATPYYSAPGGIAAPGAGPSGASGIPGYGAKQPSPGWIALVEELAIRIMLGLVGMVLLLGGFYLAGARGALANPLAGLRP
jgi:hypothetical protein